MYPETIILHLKIAGLVQMTYPFWGPDLFSGANLLLVLGPVFPVWQTSCYLRSSTLRELTLYFFVKRSVEIHLDMGKMKLNRQ